MKQIKKLLAICSLVGLFVLTIMPTVSAQGNYDDIDYNYETLNYDVDVKLSEDNVYHVEEKIKVRFLNRSHGIYRYIPYMGNMQYIEDNQIKDSKYRAKINNVKVDGHNFQKDYKNGNLVLKIGDKDRYVDGEQEYIISFDFDAGDDKISTLDRVYINLIPTGWRTAIQNASFKLTFPKEIPEDSVKVFSGTLGNATQSKFVGLVKDNVLTAFSVAPLDAFEGATVYAQVKEGYFVNERTDKPLIYLMWILIILVPLIAVILYLIFGVDKPIIKIMSVSPPKDMTPAEVGYIMDSTVDNKDVLSLIIYWADKGYLSIAQNGKDNFLLTKLIDLPTTANGYEKTMFEGLFASGDSVNTTDLKSTFYDTLQLTKSRLRSKFSKRTKTSLYTSSSRTSQVITGILSIVPIISAVILGGYIVIANFIYSILAILAIVILCGVYVGVVAMSSRWYIMSQKSRVGSIISTSIGGVLLYAVIIALGIWELNSIIPVLAAILASAISLILTCVMPKRTKQCNDWFGELLGLREFIEFAEKERIEMLVNEDPKYFYSVLPYAYVLGVSDTWSKKFESIAVAPPSWYYGGGFNASTFNTFLFLHTFNRCMTNINQNLSVPPVNMNGGNGIGGGGGFSGGGFSGGGFSGGGGGSW